MALPRTVVVVNPKSQAGAVGRRWPYFAEQLRRKLAFEAVMTQRQGDATALARQALRSGVERVVAVGGDGTINEVANGFFEDGRAIAPDAIFGVLPCGTGGDFRRTAAIPADFAGAVDVLARDQRRRIDVGRLDYTTRLGGRATRMFVNIASFGVSGVVDRLVNQSSKRLGGKLSFLVATARATLEYENQRVRLRFDGKSDDAADVTINTVAIANGRYFGGGMFIAPDAELDDGKFDVVAVGDVHLWDMLRDGHRLYRGTHLGMDKVSVRRATKVEAEPVSPRQRVELDVDGEAPGLLPATFTIVPQALQLVAPG